jgi:hypothetical protein
MTTIPGSIRSRCGFGGALRYRSADAQWHWLSGAVEPRVRTLTLESFAPFFPRAMRHRRPIVLVHADWVTRYPGVDMQTRDVIAAIVARHASGPLQVGELLWTGFGQRRRLENGASAAYLLPLATWEAALRAPVGVEVAFDNAVDVLERALRELQGAAQQVLRRELRRDPQIVELETWLERCTAVA